MSVLGKVRYSLARLFKQASMLTIVPRWVDASFLHPSFHWLTREGYRKNSAFFACLSTYTFTFPEPRLEIFTQEGDKGENIPNHPLRQLIRRPNAIMGERELMIYTIEYLGIGGNAYWHKVRNNSGRVIQLWPYHAGHMTPVPGGPNWIQRYDYDPGDGTVTPIPVDDIVHFKWPAIDPDQPWMGQPPLLAPAREVATDNEATRYLHSLLKNDAVPRTALKMPVDVPYDEEIDERTRRRFRERYGGDNKGDVAILWNGAEVDRIALDLEELAFEALHRIPEARIAAALRVPPMLVGLNAGLEHSTYSNYGEARQAFTQDTLSPLWEIVASEVDSSLVPEFGPDSQEARFDVSSVQSLQEDENALWQRAREALQSGGIMLNEYRRMLGLEEDPDGDIYIWQPTMFPIPAGDLMGGASVLNLTPTTVAPNGDGNQNEGEKRLLPDRKQNARRVGLALRRIRMSVARRMEKDVDGYFDELASRIVARADKLWQPSMEQKQDLPDIDELLRHEDSDELETLLKRFYTEVIEASWETWNAALGTEVAFDLADPAVVAALRNAGSQVREITETTRTALQDLLQFAADEGWSVDQLVWGVDDTPGLRSLVQETYRGRARTIARTELGTAQQTATVERYEGAGVRRVLVLDNGFENSHPRCKELDGTIQTLAWTREDPENTLQHPNCVRSFAPVFEEAEA